MDAKTQSRKDTQEHRAWVAKYIMIIVTDLIERARLHDVSKTEEPELSIFAEWGPKLKEMEYGSVAYTAALKEMGVALQHHYEVNRHHPEHFAANVRGMNIVDFVEMICDWKAASLRMKNGDFQQSLDKNSHRFLLNPGVIALVMNTAQLFEDEDE